MGADNKEAWELIIGPELRELLDHLERMQPHYKGEYSKDLYRTISIVHDTIAYVRGPDFVRENIRHKRNQSIPPISKRLFRRHDAQNALDALRDIKDEFFQISLEAEHNPESNRSFTNLSYRKDALSQLLIRLGTLLDRINRLFD